VHVAGFYLIQVDEQGERRFFYWREHAPVREIVAAHSPALRSGLLSSDCVFLFGITLAVIGEAGRRELLGWLMQTRRDGVAIAFDPNFRSALWPDAVMARRASSPRAKSGLPKTTPATARSRSTSSAGRSRKSAG
jgi:2-dehydro-3-deoxygluconokinase